MLDGDLQYPPEELPVMVTYLQKHTTTGVVVGKRQSSHTSKVRALGSYLATFIVGRILLGLECDLQSGMKVFRRCIAQHIDTRSVGAWTFDMRLLATARYMGYKIHNHPITFAKRAHGKSHVMFLRTAFEIALHALLLKVHQPVFRVEGGQEGDHRGHGVLFRGKRFITHSKLDLHLCALKTFSPAQLAALSFLAVITIVGLYLDALQTLIIVMGVVTFAYFADFWVNLLFIAKSLKNSPEISYSEKELQKIDDAKLPVYTILCPLYKEAAVIPQFAAAMNALDWPKERLEVIFLLEEDDAESICAAKALNLGNHFKIVIVPHSLPKTKPKACNYGLQIAKGQFIVIYDAEDIPEPLQLKKAYQAFCDSPEDIVCMQAKLNFYNTNHNLMTRLFSAEYSLWFDTILPGMQSLNTNIPLGGTSNHFKTDVLRRMHGWDAFNVAEDCDLGARLFKHGYRTAIIDSVTAEEATSRAKSWVRQRSRWIKGYMQTYLVHMRHPIAFIRARGWHAALFQLSIGGKPLTMLINPWLWTITLAYFILYAYVGPAIESLFPSVIFYMAASALVFGNFLAMYYYMIGVAKRGEWYLIKYVFFVPFYWLFLSGASYMALYQLIFKPHFWEKTTHGLHLAAVKIKVPEKVKVTVNLVDRSHEKNVTQKKRLNILFFNWRDTKHKWAGGAEVYVHNLAKRMVKAGHHVTLFCGNDFKCKHEEFVDGVKVVRRGGFFTVYFFAFVYYQIFFRKRFDIVIESINGLPFFTPLYSRRPKVLIVHHIHQQVFINHLPRWISWLPRFIEAKIVPLLYRHSQILTISNSTKKELVNLWGVPAEKVCVINPGVDFVENVPLRPKTTHPSFIYLGRLKAYKNIDVAIRAFANVVRQFPEARLSIAGEGEAGPHLVSLAKKLKLERHVYFLGKVKEHDKHLLYSESWAALQPSSTEGWGITVIEANMHATPVIARDIAGLRDSVLDGKTGLLVSGDDVKGFSAAMIQIITQEELRARLSMEAVAWARRFDWDLAADKFSSLVDELLHTCKLKTFLRPILSYDPK
jgi:cellulose synthase/poly-beta-1,6-N-acetylglucosamine synthase-like glycosyltransferase/glycosyltransferase involved in cell wall biosynthesis